MRSILVPFDFSPQSERALALALQGYPFGAKDTRIDVCHVVDDRLYKRVTNAHAPTNTAIESYLQDFVTKLRAELGPSAVVPHELSIRRGQPIVEIGVYASEHDVAGMMIGGQGHGGIVERVLGRTSQRVLRHSQTSIYVVKERGPNVSPGPILCAVDFARGSREALRQAFDLSRATFRPLELAHVLEIAPMPYIEAMSMPWADAVTASNHDLVAYEREMLGVHASHKHHVELGEPASTITRIAQERSASIVVLGWHGHGATEHMLLGSVSEQVALASPVDVWIVRGTAGTLAA